MQLSDVVKLSRSPPSRYRADLAPLQLLDANEVDKPGTEEGRGGVVQ